MAETDVEFSTQVEEWLRALPDAPDKTFLAVVAAIDLLVEDGPTLGRPVVGEIDLRDYPAEVRKTLPHLKELRPLGTDIRILFTFDKNRIPVLLHAGDKAGQWKRWYPGAIKEAARSYRAHMEGH